MSRHSIFFRRCAAESTPQEPYGLASGPSGRCLTYPDTPPEVPFIFFSAASGGLYFFSSADPSPFRVSKVSGLKKIKAYGILLGFA